MKKKKKSIRSVEVLCKFPTTFLCDHVLIILNEIKYDIFPSQTCGAFSILDPIRKRGKEGNKVPK